MMRNTLDALALSVLVAGTLAACSANVKPNTVTPPEHPIAKASVPGAAASNAPASTTATATASAALQTAVLAAATVASASPSPATQMTPAASGVTAGTSAQASAPVKMPTRGMLMSSVAREFGEPEQKLPAVPDPGTKVRPPITRWVYPEYVVYFEYNYVVHSVLKAHPFSNPSASTN
ncbi:MAG: hypothetical protein ACRETQ_12205 [Gammaproteobacteria bacterium]